MPACFCAGSVLTAVITRSALMPLVMNVLAPFTTKCSPSRIADVLIDARSEPMPGSVMAMAVMSSPDAMPGSHRALLLVGGEGEEVGEADVGVEREAEARGGHARVLQLLGDHLAVAEVVDPAAAELLGHGHPDEARGARLLEEVARHDAGVVPLEIVRRDLALDERVEALAEQVVFLGEVRAPHDAEVTPDAARKRPSWDEINRLKDRRAVL